MDISQKIVFCTGEILQDFMRKIDSQELMMLMVYDLNEEAKECIFRNMSKHAQDFLKEDIEYFNDTREKMLYYIDESIQKLPENTTQDFLKKINSQELIRLMVSDLNEEAKECIFSNMSEQAQDYLREDIEYFKVTKEKLLHYLDESIQKFPENTTANVILFTDLVNSTAKINLLGDSEYYENVLLKHNTILSNSIRKNNGRIIKTIGDAYLATFEVLPDALKACVEAQKQFNEINLNRDLDSKIIVRMAVHFGKFSLKVIENGNVDVYGSEINYAARMVGVTGGNSILVSKKFYDYWLKSRNIDYYEKKLKEQENTLSDINDEKIKSNTLKRLNHYKEFIKFIENITFYPAGVFSFKGFEKEQELFGINLEELM
jgi:class 3 adenylate cyclase/disulfide oxidoreductase YuzD